MLRLATFPEAPLRSRTVGFPESGSGLGSARHFSGRPSPTARNCVLAHPSPRRGGVCIAPSPRRRPGRNPALCLVAYRLSWPPSAQSPFARSGRYPRRGGLNTAWRGVTPSSSLIRAHAPDHPPPRASARALRAGSLQVVAVPAGRWPFPTLSPRSLRRCSDPYPAALLGCACPLLH